MCQIINNETLKWWNIEIFKEKQKKQEMSHILIIAVEQIYMLVFPINKWCQILMFGKISLLLKISFILFSGTKISGLYLYFIINNWK